MITIDFGAIVHLAVLVATESGYVKFIIKSEIQNLPQTLRIVSEII